MAVIPFLDRSRLGMWFRIYDRTCPWQLLARRNGYDRGFDPPRLPEEVSNITSYWGLFFSLFLKLFYNPSRLFYFWRKEWLEVRNKGNDLIYSNRRGAMWHSEFLLEASIFY